MTITKIDLHNHGVISLHPDWLNLQGYEGQNILQLWARRCMEKGIGICAVTSEEFQIPLNSHHDRLNYLIEQFAKNMTVIYKHDRVGKNALVVEKNGSKVYFVSGQTVAVQDHGKRLDHLVLGSNQVPNGKSLKNTIQYGKDHGLIQIAEHPFADGHFGIGEERINQHLADYDAIEGFNGELAIPEFLSWIPKLGEHNKGKNKKAKEFALKNGKPHVASSDAHSIAETGYAYIVTQSEIRTDSDLHLIEDLKDVLKSGCFRANERYQPFSSVARAKLAFMKGLSQKLDETTRAPVYSASKSHHIL